MKLSRAMSAVAVIAILLTSLTACTMTGASQQKLHTAEPTLEAGLFTKDIEVCFTNSSGASLTIKWTEGISSSDGEGTLDGGEVICAEGSYPTAVVTYLSGFQTELQAVNPTFEKPFIRFMSYLPEDQESEECDSSTGMCYITQRQKEYASWAYSVGQQIDNDIENHHILVSRQSDDSWINFLVDIKN